jgi:hypothetical protein
MVRVATPDVLLCTIGRALVETLDVSVLGDSAVEATPEFAQSIWNAWDARAINGRKTQELGELAQLEDDRLEDAVDDVVEELKLPPRDHQTECIAAYLRLTPAAIRRRFRRPANPLGTVVPAGFPLRGGEDLLPLLPVRMPKYQVGDRPWGIGDWELRELIELQAAGEVWKAVSPRRSDVPPVALHFFTSLAGQRFLRNEAAPVLDQVMVSDRIPGIVPLQQLHLCADPPCIQYAYLRAADLASLVQEWRETDAVVDPIEVADLVGQIAYSLGALHRLKPPIAQHGLRANRILLMTDGTGRRRPLLANVGLGGEPVVVETSDQSLIRKRPAVLAALPVSPKPTDDIYALGVLWYQLLVCDLDASRPGGLAWRRRLTDRGMPAALIELLEAAFDDDPAGRPADGSVLAQRIQQALANR